MGLGVGMFKWDRWPERYRGGVKFVTPTEAKQWLVRWAKRGMMQTVMTFGTPYVGGLCNCDFIDCLAVRWRLEYGITQLLKGHYVARLDYQRCTGCKACVERCQFGAIKFEVARHKTNIDEKACFGCQACALGCDYSAIQMVPRASLPGVAAQW